MTFPAERFFLFIFVVSPRKARQQKGGQTTLVNPEKYYKKNRWMVLEGNHHGFKKTQIFSGYPYPFQGA